jgi:peptidoglycan/LPS O-acetylase OafA/YrhL
VASSESGRVPALDLLRGFAALAVMLPHFTMYSSSSTSPGAEIAAATAVEVFFVLSGFVLGPQILLCAQKRNWVTLRTFLVRRWMRTIPSYLVALLVISVIFGTIGTADFVRYAFYMQNLFSQQNVRDYYPVAWSLSVEEWYYVTFPIFVLLVGRVVKPDDVWRQGFIAVLILIVAVGIARFPFDSVPDWGASVRRVVALRIDSIGYGFLLYLILRRWNIIWTHRARLLSAAFLIGATGALVYVNLGIVADEQAWPRAVYPFVSAAFGVAAIVFVLSINALAERMTSLCEFLGRISYPIYLFHLIVLYILSHFGVSAGLSGVVVYSFAVVVFAALFNYGFEQPILALRPRYEGRASAVPAAAVVTSP